jgi:hypothetical protein
MIPLAKDDADIASEQEEIARQEALRQAAGRYSRLAFGRCHNCGQDIEGAFCDSDCRQDWDRAQRIRSKQHGRMAGEGRPQ